MKKIIIVFSIFFIAIGYSQKNEISLAIRNIKLGNTYREGKDYDNAAKFIIDGIKISKKFNSFDGNYWTAVGYEYLGYLYRDMGMFDESGKNFNSALEIYRKIIKQENGSQYAIIEVLNSIAGINTVTGEIQNKAYAGNDNTVTYVGSKLKELPNDLPRNLKNLILKDNKFKQIPYLTFQFKLLEYLDLSENRIKEIPPAISQLKNLHYLDLSHNKIKEIPPSISQLQNLKELNLEDNYLKIINPNICALKKLELLNLRKNKLNFQEVLQLVKCLPNTNILFDKYEKIEEEEKNYLIDDSEN